MTHPPPQNSRNVHQKREHFRRTFRLNKTIKEKIGDMLVFRGGISFFLDFFIWTVLSNEQMTNDLMDIHFPY